jgi:hypothetical protein
MTLRRQAGQACPRARQTRLNYTYTGTGYQAGYREGWKANIGSAKTWLRDLPPAPARPARLSCSAPPPSTRAEGERTGRRAMASG